MPHRPRVVAFDIIETTFALDALRHRLADRGLPGSVLEVWFARTLRDAFALAATDTYRPFTEVAAATLRGLAIAHGVADDPDRDAAVLAGFAALEPQPDAEPALQAAKSAGFRLIALTNGAPDSTAKLLDRAGFADFFERIVSVADVRRWKPFPAIYRHAASVAGVPAGDIALVAAHAWDVQGAGNVGFTTAFVARGQPFPQPMSPPDVLAETLPEAITALASLPAA